MKRLTIKGICLLLPILLLSACANTPTSLKLTPQLDENITINKIESEKIWSVNSIDLRNARYLIAISSGDKVATLIHESTSSRLTIEKTLYGHWLKQGYHLSNKKQNDKQIEIQLIKLLAEVEQGSLSHETDINMVIKVQLNTDKITFSKTFRSHYEEKAPFSVDIKALTTQLNTQLSQLLDQIVQDPELNAKLAQL
ncbi:YajG family lipoprotein [Psychromonas hadalis]|uniref:YajG family lipoprotein n=1 Tax=Psychromonas hadalis TaxID=211669 RepID=UPI0003B49428|nr:YajG family lipoprotein [Psychromonas hadalis]